ncbi:MAG: histidine--tRNA ligase [Bacteroidales bacterium]|nr:histidine--tRNA ligase [Bacteroidales bacterium]
MAKQKPTIPKGTRDFSPEVMVKRNYIFDTIREVFQRYAYQPLETPSMENLSTLLGKYGEEGDKLLFRILNSGDYLAKVNEEDLRARDSQKLASVISEKGLRYDLTVPFARFVVQHRNEINFPFKRYQIQPVWRADKPQRGRYREFYQCDGDVIGTDSLLNEVELIQIMDDVFMKLGLNVSIKINNRKILKGLANYIQNPEKFMDLTMAIDKLDKIGHEKVKEELKQRGINTSAVEELDPFLNLEGKNYEKVEYLVNWLSDDEGSKGIGEIREILDYTGALELNNEVEFDPKLARGLDYYTGTIFEVKALDEDMGSICGGGRYDDLTGVFGLKDVSGVGISFGAERIYDVMEKLRRFPSKMLPAAKIMFVNFGREEAKHALKVLRELHEEGIKSEIYPDTAKMKKQMTYANNKGIEYVGLMGEDEISKQVITVKNMTTGEQKKMTLEELKELLAE